MIKLKLSFGKEQQEQKFDIVQDELLSAALERALADVPKNGFETEEMFVVTVNGLMIEKAFWTLTKLNEADTVIISPKIGSGEGGQIFKQALIVVISVVASVVLTPAGGATIYSALAVAAVTIGATLLLNALIPPPVPNLGAGPGAVGDVDSSQMYAISGQSNQMRRLGIVPKVYGTHRMFPTLAVTPYTELAVSPGNPAAATIEDLNFYARTPGPPGNGISIVYQGGGTAGSEVVAVASRTITLTYAVGVSTATQIKSKLQASAAAMAIVGVNLIGDGSAAQTFTGQESLSGGEVAGETVQYLYGIYDFGLGVMDVNDIKIGDTPLTTDSFREFEVRLVDPAKPDIDEDDYDSRLTKEFKNYRTRRVTTPLSLALNIDGSELIQFSDDNTDEVAQEILVDVVAPRGLFGYSSNGATGERRVLMYLHFALVGTDDWKPYNDMNYVDSFSSVGGTDVTDFEVQLAPLFPDDPSVSTYYTTYYAGNSSYNSSNNIYLQYYIAPRQKLLLVPDDSRYEIGAKIFMGTSFLGIIQAITNLPGGNTQLQLDRIISYGQQYLAYTFNGHRTYATGPVPGQGNITTPTVVGRATDVKTYRSSRHESAAAVMVGSRAAPVYGNFRFRPKVPGQYQVRLRRVNAIGTYNTQKEDNITWQGLTTAYQEQPISTTKRHCFLELKIKATNQLNGNIQNLSGLVSSVLPIYNPDTGQWVRATTNNPAWVFCDLLTGEVNKRSVARSRLHMDSILEWAAYCEEIPTPPPSATYLEPRFQCNFVLDYDSTLATVLGQVGSMGQASLNIMDGKYGVLVDRFKEVPVQIFTPRNSKDFSSTRLYGPRPHGLRVKYIDPQLNWEVNELTVYDNGYDEDNATDFDDLTSFATTNYEQAWRFGRYMLAQNKLRHETISILVDFENMVCTRGDYVQITQDSMRVGGTPARVKEVAANVITIDDALDINPSLDYGYVFRSSSTGEIITPTTLTPLTARTFELDGVLPVAGDLVVIGEMGRIVYDCIVKSISPNDDMSAQLTLVEKADEIFEYESSDVLPEYDPQLSDTSRPDFYPPKAVTGLAVTDNFWECNVVQSGYNYYIELIWDIPPGSVYEYFEVWVNDGRGYKVAVATTAKLYKYNVDQTRLGDQHGFKVVAVSASGKKLELIAMPEVTATPVSKATPPSDVDALNMSITNQVLQLNWDFLDDCDVREYALRYSPDTNDVWESSIPLINVARDVNSASVQARTGVYLVKAFDYNGNQSLVAAKALTTIPSLFDLNIIETLNDAPAFDGTFEQTETLGEAVVLQEQVPGDADNVIYYSEGYYVCGEMLDVGDIYSVRLQSLIRADGYKKGELMSEWEHLSEIEHLNSALSSDWNAVLQYRASDVFSSMADWVHLSEIDHLNLGAGIGFTEWRDVPSVGDATGRVFQFRVKLQSFTANVTPRLFDASIKADMPDRTDSFENQISSAGSATVISYDPSFKGPGTTPNVQVSIDGAQTGDYWSFDNKSLDGFSIRFYDKNGIQVVRQFDAVAKGYGHRHTATL